MTWNSWADFWNMGGYAWYVWGSYGLTALLMILEVLLVRQRRNNVLRQLAREARLQTAKAEDQ